MPYQIRKVTKRRCYKLYNRNTKKVFSKCGSKPNVQKQLRLLRALQYNKTFKPYSQNKTSGGKTSGGTTPLERAGDECLRSPHPPTPILDLNEFRKTHMTRLSQARKNTIEKYIIDQLDKNLHKTVTDSVRLYETGEITKDDLEALLSDVLIHSDADKRGKITSDIRAILRTHKLNLTLSNAFTDSPKYIVSNVSRRKYSHNIRSINTNSHKTRRRNP